MTAAWLYLLVLPPLAPLVRDDFRIRQVAVAWLAVLCAVAFAAGWGIWGVRLCLFQAGMNLLLLLVTGTSVMLYLRVRHGVRGRKIGNWLGAGDAVFLAAVAPLFTPVGYVWFLIVSCLAALVWNLAVRWRTIPLVGVMGVVLGLYAVCKSCGLWN